MRILIPIGCRSDEGLSAPLRKLLREDDGFELQVKRLSSTAGYFSYCYFEMENYFNALALKEKTPDLVMIFGDRIEMLAVAITAREANVPIAHVYAGCLGEKSEKATLDDVNRTCISALSQTWFCESYHAMRKVERILRAHGRGSEAKNLFIVGITHLDDLEVDESLVPEFDYNLVLINPEIEMANLKKAIKLAFINNTIYIGHNPDNWISDTILTHNAFVKEFFDVKGKDSRFYDNVERAKFFGLLKNCKRFITNSSTAIYEAPYFLKPEQIIQVGKRNADRDEGPFLTGASKKILHVLKHGKLPEIKFDPHVASQSLDKGRRFA